jgi:hypothetical protein
MKASNVLIVGFAILISALYLLVTVLHSVTPFNPLVDTDNGKYCESENKPPEGYGNELSATID